MNAPLEYTTASAEELRAVLDAHREQGEPPPDAPRVEVMANNTFTSICSQWDLCLHVVEWRDVYWWVVDGEGRYWCPFCLPDEIRRGEVVLANPAEAEKVLAKIVEEFACEQLTGDRVTPRTLGLIECIDDAGRGEDEGA
jgi:mannose-6-phosphate isomerase-like protein (cupin superfamily)